MSLKDANGMTNNTDPDQIKEQSDLCMHCLLKPFCPNIQNYYNKIWWMRSDIRNYYSKIWCDEE